MQNTIHLNILMTVAKTYEKVLNVLDVFNYKSESSKFFHS